MFSIEITNLNFSYNVKSPILKNLNLQVPKGSIYGFIGHNGAGKSTTMRLIAGLYPDDFKKVKVFDKYISDQLPNIFNRIGALIESPTLYQHLSGEDNLKYIATIRKVDFDKIDDILNTVDLLQAKKKLVKNYSLGMKQRLAIAMAMIHDPELLLLDEPINGLDPTGIIEMRELLLKINQEKGTTIFISSHLLGEIEKTCTHVGIIARGEIKFEGTIKELENTFSTFLIEIETNLNVDTSNWILNNIQSAQILSKQLVAFSIIQKEDIPQLIKKLTEQNIPIYSLKNKRGLEEWFLEITNN
ncbi:ABC transporter ATP-binding protein [Flavobacterium sedimenticola]|uniref:ABC transporter ATP-binding protein n=1 Tax=Flavobacterium sedimenticola TaxID=3043286 RepID=A0ABT6XSH1_9FLAO|nr:ABC transporter ATP-binding protein [Flavobacterium sedimenticola]MDI9257917.1 ABC transporter ATP-binding protein [Flavobacterium sedimenticola]